MNLEHITTPAIDLARTWAANASAASGKARRSANKLARLVADPAGLDLAVDFVDLVARPEDSRAAAKALRSLDTSAASFLNPVDKGLLKVGSALAPYVPVLVVPAARMRLRQLVGHLVVDAADDALTRHIATVLQTDRLNLNLLGEAVLGESEAKSRTERTRALLERSDVDYVSVKVSSLVSQISTWDTAGSVARVLERLRPVLRQAMRTTPHKFVNLDMEEYRDLALTVEVFEHVLSEPEFMSLSAGIVLQAYLPDSVEAMHRLTEFATARREAGGAPIKIRLVKGANLAMERVDAEIHGWAQAPYLTKSDVDANFLHLIDHALRPEVAYAVRLGVASHNLFHVAFAHLLAQERGVEAALDVEMLHGMAPGEAAAVQSDVANPIVLYTPVVAREDFDVAVAYLVRRLEEAAAEENYLHDQFTGSLEQQEEAFRRAVTHEAPSTPRRSSTRTPAGDRFANTTNSDPALASVRTEAQAALDHSLPELAISTLNSDSDVDRVVATAVQQGPAWAATPGAKRAEILRTIADELEKRRQDLLTVMAHEAGKTLAEADPEISEAIDFARYYADRAEELEYLESADGLQFTPDLVVLVTPPWNFPVAIPMGGVLAALAAGSGVIIKPAPQTPRCAQVGIEAVHAGLAAHDRPSELVQIVQTDEAASGRALVAHDDVDTVILTGGLATAQLFTSWRVRRERGPRVFAETSGKNALIVTPSADYDLAVADVVESAFGNAGQKCSAASLLILVGSVATSERFRRQLLDAVSSLVVDWPTNLSATVGPVIEAPTSKLKRALTTLEEGERWIVEPEEVGDSGRLWRPGVKEGIEPGSQFHQTEYFGPVLGIMEAESLEQAIAWQNATEYGLTGGIHSLNDAEVEQWLVAVEVGNAYVNRHITGAIVQRQSFGGWKNSSVGPGAKAGGPNYVSQLGTWTQVSAPLREAEIGPRVVQFLDTVRTWISQDSHAWLHQAAFADAEAREWYRTPRDLSGLRSEANILRYRPGPLMTFRAGETNTLTEVLRVVMAALTVGIDAGVTVHPKLLDALPADIRQQYDALYQNQEPEEPAQALEEPAQALDEPAQALDEPAQAPDEPAQEPESHPAEPQEAEEVNSTDSESIASEPDPQEPGPAIDGMPTGVDLAQFPIRIVAGWRGETTEEFTTRASTWPQSGRIRLLDEGETTALNEAVSTSVTVLAGRPLLSGRRELLALLREQAISRTEHRFGHIPGPPPTTETESQ